MEAQQSDDARIRRANALYWESNKSVNQIADEMELSKGMLYGLIRPLGGGLPCPRCATDLEYTNRTARERGFLTCPACGLEQEEDQVSEAWREAAAATPGGQLLVTPPLAAPRAAPGIVPDRRRRDPLMLGAGLLLVAAGLWIFRGLNRR